MSKSIRMGSIFQRVAAAFASALGLLALTLASVGIYGVVAYTTRQRTREIGVRMALGARRYHVLMLVLQQGFLLTLTGLVIGLGLAWALTPLLRNQLYDVAATDVATYAGVGALLCVVALLACYIPARRATKVEPVVALHYE
jgi:ABC-type antimicrobial peptide transport system permease subunit